MPLGPKPMLIQKLSSALSKKICVMQSVGVGEVRKVLGVPRRLFKEIQLHLQEYEGDQITTWEGNLESHCTEKPPQPHQFPKPQIAGGEEHTSGCFCSYPSTCFQPLMKCCVRRSSTVTHEDAPMLGRTTTATWGPELVAQVHPRAKLELYCCRSPQPVFAGGRWCRSISDSDAEAQG